MGRSAARQTMRIAGNGPVRLHIRRDPTPPGTYVVTVSSKWVQTTHRFQDGVRISLTSHNVTLSIDIAH